MNELALFAGAGGGILGGHLLGWRTVCAVERDAYAAQVLAQRQNDGILQPFPIWSDVCSFDGKPWRGIVDIVSGGFPCQDISAAGKGAGINGEKSGLWRHMARIIGEVRPRFVLVENSPMLVRRGLALVIGDLAQMGYDAKWGRISALDTGAPHDRDRIWIVGEVMDNAISERFEPGRVYHREDDRNQSGTAGEYTIQNPNICTATGYDNWPDEPGMGRVANGVAHRVDRIKALGNGQVPRVAATAFSLLREK
ncbi:DNA cytosine methyltransferase [Klebsiella pneumoniae]|uniref:DNA cytosine methyltransferase n=1 Tax=Klebsiella pneumoniae TaxID=573 RepID=UPI0021A86B98